MAGLFLLIPGRRRARFLAEKQSLGSSLNRRGDAPPRTITRLSKPIGAWPYCRCTLAIRRSEFALLKVRVIDGLAVFMPSRALPAPTCAAPQRRSRVRFARDLYNREGEFDAVGLQGFVDHRMVCRRMTNFLPIKSSSSPGSASPRDSLLKRGLICGRSHQCSYSDGIPNCGKRSVVPKP